MDENLKLWANVFKVLMHCYPCKFIKIIILLRLELPDEICFFDIFLKKVFQIWLKALLNKDFSTDY